MIDNLDKFYMDRVSQLKNKVFQTLEKVQSEDEVVRLLLQNYETRSFGEQRCAEILKEGFQIEQELQIENIQKMYLVKEQ